MTSEQATTVKEFLLPQMELEVGLTARVLASVPDDKTEYAPHERCSAAGVLARHILGADAWFLQSVVNGALLDKPAPPEGKDSASLAAEYEARIKDLLGKVRDLPGEHLAKDFVFYKWTMPCISVLQLMQKHSIHHRGQLSVYLRPMGAKVPAIYGGSADEPMS